MCSMILGTCVRVVCVCACDRETEWLPPIPSATHPFQIVSLVAIFREWCLSRSLAPSLSIHCTVYVHTTHYTNTHKQHAREYVVPCVKRRLSYTIQQLYTARAVLVRAISSDGWLAGVRKIVSPCICTVQEKIYASKENNHENTPESMDRNSNTKM